MANWIDLLKRVTVFSPYFDKNNDFPIFVKNDKGESCRVSFVFGENGTGKSTLVKALKNINDTTKDCYAIVKDGVRAVTLLNPDKQIFIYNQEFIDNNVRYLSKNENGLQTIVLLGGQVDLQKEIDAINDKIKIEKAKLQEIEIKLDGSLDIKNTTSFKYWKKIIQDGEVGNAWRRRESNIKGKNASIGASIFDEIVSYRCGDENETTVKIRLDSCLEKYNKLNDVLVKAMDVDRFRCLKKLPNIEIDVNKLISYLTRKIDKKILNEVAEKIRSELSASDLEASRNMLMSHETDFCPLCLRQLNIEDRKKSLGIIDDIVDREERELGNRLRMFKMRAIDVREYEEWKDVDNNKFNNLVGIILKINEFIENVHNKIIDEKINRPSMILEYPSEGLFRLIERFNSVKNELQTEVNLIINSIDNKENIIKELHSVNVDIAHYGSVTVAKEYRKTLEVCNKLNNDKLSQERVIDDLMSDLNEKKAAQKDEKIAIEVINDWLTLIYGTNKRLQLQMSLDGVYRLLVRNKHVSPDKLSQGEQNTLALVYFFAKITEGSAFNKLFDSSVLVAIDDPVSSFDDDVKIGILSFINYVILSIIESNESSKILITTHDASVFNKLLKIGSGLKKKGGMASYKLDEGKMIRVDGLQFSEYEMLMYDAFVYACAEPVIDNPAIGNILRRIMEAASTYHFKKNVNDINFDMAPFDNLPKAVTQHFKNVCLRMFLNGKSHQQEIIGTTDWTIVTGSGLEARRIARVVFCILYTLSASHVRSFLSRFRPDDIDNSIKQWIEELE